MVLVEPEVVAFEEYLGGVGPPVVVCVIEIFRPKVV